MLEQRHKAVLEVMAGETVTDVARRYGVAHQTLHDWLRRYAKGRHGRPLGPQLQAGHLPAPDGPRDRGPGLRSAP
jgi:transposase-like protein